MKSTPNFSLESLFSIALPFSKLKNKTLLFLSAILMMCSFVSWGQVIETYSTSGTYTWICPSGVTSITVQAWGGGGAGGGVNTTAVNRAGGGGGGGAFATSTVNVVPGTSYTIVVGAGGTGVSAANGNNGNSSTFASNVLVAAGGLGGSGHIATSSTIMNGGLGALTSSCTPSTGAFSGGNGGSSATTPTSGGGGGGAGSTGNGNAASGVTAGSAGSGGGGGGATGLSSNNAAGGAGNSPGGGGAGARAASGSTTARAGGSGGAGQVRITYTQPNATLPYLEDFSNGGWITVNGSSTNKWVLGSVTGNTGNSMYISNDNGTSNAYTHTITSVHTYRDITIPSNSTLASLAFDWKANGESGYDFLRVWLVPTTYTPVAGTAITSGSGRIQVGGDYNLQTSWQTYSNSSLNVSSFANTTMRLIFEWRNDGSGGTTPPAAIDNISFTLAPACSAPTSLASTASSTAQSNTTISASFTAANSAPTAYLVVRTDINTQPVPVTGTTYATGSNAIGFIEYVGATAGSWTSTSLTPGATYYYWVFSYNNTNCTGGPVYSASTTSFSQATSSCTGSALANLSYTALTANYCLSSAITNNTATLGTSSGVPTYSISPALPTGLSLSTSTGTISGTPTAAVSSTNYTVTADNGCTNTTATLTITTNALPATPASSAATLAGTYGFTANWTASAGATAYFLDVSTSSSFTSMVSGYDGLNVGNVTTYGVTGLGSGTTYYYRVRSTNGTCNSLNSTSQTTATTALSSVASGNWNSGSTWSGGQVPTCNDNVTILTGNTVTVNSSSNVSKNTTINSGGTLTIASGDLTVGCTLNNTPLTNNGTLTVSGGTLNVNGFITSSGTFTQSNGSINIDPNNDGIVANSTTSSQYTLNLSGTVQWTGGTLTLIDPPASTSSSHYTIYYSSSNSYDCIGHTLRFGDGISSSAGGNAIGFLIYNYVGSGRLNFGHGVVNGPSSGTAASTNRIVQQVSYSNFFNGNFTINNGGEFVNTNITVGGDVTVNSGGILTSTSTLTLAKPSGSSSAIASTVAQSITGSGTFRNATTSSTASLLSLTVNNTSSSGVTISTPISISGTLTMTAGKINTTATNLLTLGTASAAGTLTYTAGQITGPFARTFAVSGSTTPVYDGTTLFPVGDGTSYIPIHIDPINGGGVVQMRGQAFNTNSGTGGSGVASVLSTDRWEAFVTLGTITDCFIGLNDAQIASGNIIAQSSSASGTYNAISGASTFVSGTPNALRTAVQIPNASYSGFFTYAAPGPAITSFAPTSVCPNAIATITVTGTNLGSATSVTLNGESCTITNNTTTSVTFTTDATPQAGNVVVTTAANSATSATPLSLFTLPTVTALASSNDPITNNTICSGTSVTLNGGGASSYTWNNGVSNNSSFTPISTSSYTVTGTDANGCTNTASLTVTVNNAVNITSQPVNAVVLLNTNATFSVTATGTSLTYQWEENTGSAWSAISNVGIYSGATSNTLTLTNVSSSESGHQYRCVISGTTPCVAATTSVVTLTISSTAITAQPQNQSICLSSGTASFSVSTTGSTPTYQWQLSTNSGSNWSDITGEISASLSLSNLTLTESGNLYRCVLNGNITSSSASLTVSLVSVAGTVSSNQAICSGSTPSSITLSGNTGSIQWQVSTDNNTFNDISGATSSTLAASTIGALTNTQYYRAVVTSGGCSATNSSAVTVTVTPTPNAGTLSGTQTLCANATTTFSSNGGTGGTWSSATTSTATVNSSTGVITGVAAGTTTITYTITGTGGCSNATATRTVTVNAVPPITSATATPSTVCAGSTISLSAASVSVATGTANLGVQSSTTITGGPYRGGNCTANKVQYLITAAELTNAGVSSGNINSLTFVTTSTGSALPNFTISIANTSLTSMSSTMESNGFTQVFSASSYTPTSGNNLHTFSTPFNWNGSSNIIINVCHDYACSSSATMSMSSPGYAATTYLTTGSSGSNCSTLTGGTTATTRPVMIFNCQVGTNNAANYTWSWNSTPTVSTATGTTTSVNNTSNATTQTYTVTATVAATGCSSTATTSAVTINPVPATPTANNSSICGPQNATCSVTGTGISGNTFKWYTVPTGGTMITGQTSSTLSAYPISTTTSLYASEANSNCESARVEVIQTVTTPPTITASASSSTVCSGSSTTLSASSLNTGYTYTWNNNAGSGTSVTVSPTSTTTYTVTGTDASGGASNGCSSTATVAVAVNPLPSAVTISPSSTSICSGSTTQLTGSPALISNVSGYSTNVSTGASLADVSGGTDLIGQNQDDLASALANIGFNFVYEGNTYTQFSANSNGLIRLGGTVVSNDWSNALSDVSDDPKIMPIWDDISTGTSGYVRYKLNGSSPNRVLVVEFFGRMDATETSASTSKFQTLFYETSNLIEFVYGTSSANPASATIGISGILNTNYMARKNVNNNNFGNSSAAENIATWPVEGTKYTFIPTPTYSWTGGPIASGASTATATVNPTSLSTYTLTSTNTWGCSISSTATITVNEPTLTWTGATSSDPTVASNWSPVGLPCTVSAITIPVVNTNYPTYTSLTISSGGTFTLQSGAQLTVAGALTNNGTMTIESGATFKQGTSVAGTGTYNVQQALDNCAGSGSTLTGRYWYLGSPVSCTRSSSFGSASVLNKVWSFTNGAYGSVADATTLSPTSGYVHRRSDNATLTFTGTNLYAQDATLSLSNNAGTYAGWHLVSNPYTAYLDWSQMYNASSNISASYYIRSYNTTGNDVDALITYSASTGLEANTSSYNLGSVGSNTAQYIAPMQAIWVKVLGSTSTVGSLSLNRNYTSHQTGGLKSSTIFPTLARVNLVNGARFDQMLVYMNPDMTNGVDQYDSEKMFVTGAPQLYTMAAGKKLVMNGLKNNKSKISVPLYLELPESKVYQLSLAEYILEDGLILLEDKQEGTIQDFTIHDVYSFYATSGVLSNRFVLHFFMPDNGITAQGPSNSWVEEEAVINEGGNILVNSNGRGKVTIQQDIDQSPTAKGSVVVRDAAGREVWKGQLSGSATTLELDTPSGIYFVEVELNGKVEMKKIFVQQ